MLGEHHRVLPQFGSYWCNIFCFPNSHGLHWLKNTFFPNSHVFFGLTSCCFPVPMCNTIFFPKSHALYLCTIICFPNSHALKNWLNIMFFTPPLEADIFSVALIFAAKNYTVEILVGGLEHVLFSHILGIIFFRGVQTTNQDNVWLQELDLHLERATCVLPTPEIFFQPRGCSLHLLHLSNHPVVWYYHLWQGRFIYDYIDVRSFSSPIRMVYIGWISWSSPIPMIYIGWMWFSSTVPMVYIGLRFNFLPQFPWTQKLVENIIFFQNAHGICVGVSNHVLPYIIYKWWTFILPYVLPFPEISSWWIMLWEEHNIICPPNDSPYHMYHPSISLILSSYKYSISLYYHHINTPPPRFFVKSTSAPRSTAPSHPWCAAGPRMAGSAEWLPWLQVPLVFFQWFRDEKKEKHIYIYGHSGILFFGVFHVFFCF